MPRPPTIDERFFRKHKFRDIISLEKFCKSNDIKYQLVDKNSLKFPIFSVEIEQNIVIFELKPTIFRGKSYIICE